MLTIRSDVKRPTAVCYMKDVLLKIDSARLPDGAGTIAIGRSFGQVLGSFHLA